MFFETQRKNNVARSSSKFYFKISRFLLSPVNPEEFKLLALNLLQNTPANHNPLHFTRSLINLSNLCIAH